MKHTGFHQYDGQATEVNGTDSLVQVGCAMWAEMNELASSVGSVAPSMIESATGWDLWGLCGCSMLLQAFTMYWGLLELLPIQCTPPQVLMHQYSHCRAP